MDLMEPVANIKPVSLHISNPVSAFTAFGFRDLVCDKKHVATSSVISRMLVIPWKTLTEDVMLCVGVTDSEKYSRQGAAREPLVMTSPDRDLVQEGVVLPGGGYIAFLNLLHTLTCPSLTL